jgi:hypothetical protein
LVIPVRNAATTLTNSAASRLSKDLPVIEIIPNGSNHQTPRIAQSTAVHRFFNFSPKRIGRSAAAPPSPQPPDTPKAATFGVAADPTRRYAIGPCKAPRCESPDTARMDVSKRTTPSPWKKRSNCG